MEDIPPHSESLKRSSQFGHPVRRERGCDKVIDGLLYLNAHLQWPLMSPSLPKAGHAAEKAERQMSLVGPVLQGFLSFESGVAASSET